jgi:ketosteroid isomerase-like protein
MAVMTLVALSGLAGPALAGPAEEARRVYAEFVAAQNAHDLGRVRSLLVEDRRFLWVTNGLSLWGPEAMTARLSRFHANEVWRLETMEERARAVEVNEEAALLHVPVALVVGPRAAPQRYRILVTALVARGTDGWRIAGLFTTDENTEEGGR